MDFRLAMARQHSAKKNILKKSDLFSIINASATTINVAAFR
jgi:hypothetical protein